MCGGTGDLWSDQDVSGAVLLVHVETQGDVTGPGWALFVVWLILWLFCLTLMFCSLLKHLFQYNWFSELVRREE